MLFSLIVFYVGSVLADERPVYTLPPIVIEGTALESLNADAIVPALKASQESMAQPSASGSLGSGLKRDLALPVNDYGKPGNLTSLRGLGRSTEEVNTEVLGVPLNYAQGGGFDLSIYPQFLWSDYRFQLGPSLSTLDVRAGSGTLLLEPWTSAALQGDEQTRIRILQSYSGAAGSQSAIGVKHEDRFASLVGFSAGDARGPAGSLSGRWGERDARVQGKYHFLGTRLDAQIPGSRTFPTPRARQISTRLTPVFQADFRLSEGDTQSLLKTTWFYDATYLKYDDADSYASRSRDRALQGGGEIAWIQRDWRVGLVLRQVSYSKLDFQAPTEQMGSASVLRKFRLAQFVVEPSVQAVGVSRYGVLPAGSLGARLPFSLENAAFARVSYSYLFPSIADRYYDLPVFSLVGNRDLKVEKDLTLVSGVEMKCESVKDTLQFYSRWKEDAQVSALVRGNLTKINSGSANVIALMNSFQWEMTPHWDLFNQSTITDSYVQATASSFSYLPRASTTLGMRLHSRMVAVSDSRWAVTLSQRFVSSSAVTSNADRVSGYGMTDLQARYHLQALALTAGVENVLNRNVEIQKGYPAAGRTFVAGIVGEF